MEKIEQENKKEAEQTKFIRISSIVDEMIEEYSVNQSEVAKIINASEGTISGWRNETFQNTQWHKARVKLLYWKYVGDAECSVNEFISKVEKYNIEGLNEYLEEEDLHKMISDLKCQLCKLYGRIKNRTVKKGKKKQSKEQRESALKKIEEKFPSVIKLYMDFQQEGVDEAPSPEPSEEEIAVETEIEKFSPQEGADVVPLREPSEEEIAAETELEKLSSQEGADETSSSEPLEEKVNAEAESEKTTQQECADVSKLPEYDETAEFKSTSEKIKLCDENEEKKVLAKGYYKTAKKFAKKNNLLKEIEYLNKAAELDHSKALYELGKIYLDGRGIVPDMSRAFSYFCKAAELKEGTALQEIAMIYLKKGDKEEYSKGLWLLELAQKKVQEVNILVPMEKKRIKKFKDKYYKRNDPNCDSTEEDREFRKLIHIWENI